MKPLRIIFPLILSLAYVNFNWLPEELLAQSSNQVNQTVSTYKTEFNRLINDGVVRFQYKDYEGAITISQEALKLAKRNDDLHDQIMALWLLGTSYRLIDRYIPAKNSFESGLELVAQTENSFYNNDIEKRTIVYRLRVFLLTGLGVTYSKIGEYGEAAKQLELAFSLSGNTANLPQLVLDNYFETRFELAQLYRKQGEYQKAINLLFHARLLAVQMKDRQREAITLTATGNNLVSLGNILEAQKHYNLAMQLGDSNQEPLIEIAPQRINALQRNLGDVSNFFDKIVPTLQEISQIIRKMAKLTASDSRFVILGEMADDLDKTTQSMIRVLANLKQGNWAEPASINELQRNMSKMRKNMVTLRSLIESMRQNPEEFNNSFNPQTIREFEDIIKKLDLMNSDLRGVSRNHNKVKETQKDSLMVTYWQYYFDKVKQSKKQSVINELNDLIRESYSQRTGQLYINSGRRLLETARNSRSPLIYGQALHDLGISYSVNRDYPNAEQSLMEAITIWEKLRVGLEDKESYRVSLFETQNKTYYTLQQVRVAMQKYPEALEAAEQGRARAFVAMLSAKLPSTQTPKYAEPSITVQQIKEIARNQNITIVSYSLISQMPPMANKQPLLGQSKLYVWVVSPTGVIQFKELDLENWEIANGELLSATVNCLQGKLSSPSGTAPGCRAPSVPTRSPNPRKPIPDEELDDTPNELKSLYQLLIRPIEEFLPTDPEAKVVFIPHADLFLVPFAALREQSGKYLIEKHTISYAPSIQILAFTEKLNRGIKGQENLIIGNPSGDLKGAEQEALDIAKILNSTAIVGKAATKSNVLSRISQANTIHLAMHGSFDDLESALDFGSQIKLTAKEVLDLKLQANLVVLSACSTGKGTIKSDGVIGLSRSFILAGTPRIIVSLWNVPDKATGKLIVNFYENMYIHNRQKNNDYSQALRQAMLNTMKIYPHPRNWAAFSLFGSSNQQF